MTVTWIVWSPRPPECRERVTCASVLDAARAWAERQFKRGMAPIEGMEVHARCEGDASPNLATYRVKIMIAAAPAYRGVLAGMAFEETPTDPVEGARRG